MGYVYAELDAAARGLVLALMHYRDGATVGQLSTDEYEGGPVPVASADELVELGYVLRYRVDGDEDGDEVLELMDRGWRWVEETARRPTSERAAAFGDADTTELIGWALFGDLLRFAEPRGETIADVFPVQELRPLRPIHSTRTETAS